MLRIIIIRDFFLEKRQDVTVAFDFMSVRLSELAWAPALLPGLQLLYPEAEKEGEDDEDAGGERLPLKKYKK